MIKRALSLSLVALALTGCGGGHGTSSRLVVMRPGARWVYSFNGNVVLPGGGGSALPVQASHSTITYQVSDPGLQRLNGNAIYALDRVIALNLLDGRQVNAVDRLYFMQLTEGISIVGFNNTQDTTVSPANNRFIGGGSAPTGSVLYLPDPVADNTALQYSNPFGLTTAGDHSYGLQIGSQLSNVSVPAGSFIAKPIVQAENFASYSVNGFITPGTGIISGTLSATLPDTTRLGGTIQLTSVTF